MMSRGYAVAAACLAAAVATASAFSFNGRLIVKKRRNYSYLHSPTIMTMMTIIDFWIDWLIDIQRSSLSLLSFVRGRFWAKYHLISRILILILILNWHTILSSWSMTINQQYYWWIVLTSSHYYNVRVFNLPRDLSSMINEISQFYNVLIITVPLWTLSKTTFNWDYVWTTTQHTLYPPIFAFIHYTFRWSFTFSLPVHAR